MLTDFQKSLLNDRIGIQHKPVINTDSFIPTASLTIQEDDVRYRSIMIDDIIEEARYNGLYFKTASVELNKLAKDEEIVLYDVRGSRVHIPWVDFKYGVLVNPQAYVMQAYTGYGDDYKKRTRNDGAIIKGSIEKVASMLGVDTKSIKDHPVSRGLSVLAAVRDSGGDSNDLLQGLRNIVDEYTSEELEQWGISNGEWDLYKTVSELSDMVPADARSSQRLNKALAYQQWITSVASGESDVITYIAELADRMDVANGRITELIDVARGKVSLSVDQYGEDPVAEGYRIISSTFRGIIEKGNRSIRDSFSQMISGLSRAEHKRISSPQSTSYLGAYGENFFEELWRQKFGEEAKFLIPGSNVQTSTDKTPKISVLALDADNPSIHPSLISGSHVPLGQQVARQLRDNAEITAPTAVRALSAGGSIIRSSMGAIQNLIMAAWFRVPMYHRNIEINKQIRILEHELERSDSIEDLELVQPLAIARNIVDMGNQLYGDERSVDRCIVSIVQNMNNLRDMNQFIDLAEGANVAREVLGHIEQNGNEYSRIITSPRVSEEEMELYLADLKQAVEAPKLSTEALIAMVPHIEEPVDWDGDSDPDAYFAEIVKDGGPRGQD